MGVSENGGIPPPVWPFKFGCVPSIQFHPDVLSHQVPHCLALLLEELLQAEFTNQAHINADK